ncbi:MAG: PQQ-binding-like beta-propeller repeat protein [Bacteroidetes bacterium]|nr:PQQ-binding-like beta-propeller repeat protein [Bacteroidota bacterium]
MKNLTLLLFLLISNYGLYAQKPFPMLYKSQWPVDCKWRLSNADRTLALGGDLQDIAMLDATTGKLLWRMNFKASLGVKNAKVWSWDENRNAVFVTVKGDKKDELLTTWYDELTGAKIDDNTTKQVKYERVKVHYKTSKSSNIIYKGSIDDDEMNIHLRLNYKSKATSTVGKGTKIQIILESTGAFTWNNAFEGRVLRSLCEGEDYITMELHGDQIYVIYEGISIFDLKTGKKLWETGFDNIELNWGVVKSTQTLGKSDMPTIGDDGVYIIDLSKGNHKIRKFNPATGAVIWETVEFDKDAMIPDMGLLGSTLIAKVGGEIETQTFIPGTNGNPDVCNVGYKMTGPFGLMAFDSHTGKLLWDTKELKTLGDKFSGSISNIHIDGENVIFCTSKNMFCLEAATGKVVWKTDLAKTGVGMVSYIWERSGSLIASGEKGTASITISNGKLNWATKIKKNFGTFGTPDAYYVWVGKSAVDVQDFIRLDLDNGKILGIQKATKYPQFTPDYNEFLKYDGKKIFRYKSRQ